ncbi:hypothetical protein RND81_07G018400 [Saponaria officinalis]|uniref:BHLH domain-containing protein n=1 Tax=Saponaria officinalis TaxID=3572 RepID=A0AAW1JM52_SAPOF
MSTQLHQLLRNLCWNTEWNYAVFWKLKHRARMVLTWEDGYYNDQYKLDHPEIKSFSEDSLSLAVAKMSYHVYSLGEGIVGQVAVTGQHQWIFSDEHATNSFSLFELCDGWQAQFAAGIKTIVIAAIVPYGVVQFGSLYKVNENVQFLAYIRDAFSSLHGSAFHMPAPILSSQHHILQMMDISSSSLNSDVLQDNLHDKAANRDHAYSSSAGNPGLQKHVNDSSTASMPGVHLQHADGLSTENRLLQTVGNAELVRAVPAEVQQSTDLLDPNCNGQICFPSQSCLTESSTLYDIKLTGEKSEVRFKYSSADYSVSAACSTAVFDNEDHPREEKIDELVVSDSLTKKSENITEILPEFNCLETTGNLNSPFTFSAGAELHEALGPAFLKQCYPFSCDAENPERNAAVSQMPKAIESSMLTSDSNADHLLEAVVADFCRRDELHSRKSFSNSDSMVTTEETPETSINKSYTIGSSCYSLGCSSFLDESTQNCLNSSDSCGIRSSASACREQLPRSGEPGKPNKKRARPGENSRPRPRDRQLIQDRIKELRELVPNGSKCSIDSLLERTIKHMAFMQNVTKHSDKLSKCAKSKGCGEMGVLGSGFEQGSSWAVEVGGHMKICPILVENINMNGQMLIEMLCEDCDHFLEITEAIRSLGLTILKGITDSHGDKTWMRFVVEGQNNRNLHRMDVLWSLVQILQSKTTVS